jgi:hypothetical protein
MSYSSLGQLVSAPLNLSVPLQTIVPQIPLPPAQAAPPSSSEMGAVTDIAIGLVALGGAGLVGWLVYRHHKKTMVAVKANRRRRMKSNPRRAMSPEQAANLKALQAHVDAKCGDFGLRAKIATKNTGNMIEVDPRKKTVTVSETALALQPPAYLAAKACEFMARGLQSNGKRGRRY